MDNPIETPEMAVQATIIKAWERKVILDACGLFAALMTVAIYVVWWFQ